MACSECQDKPKKTCGKLPPVLQINSEECPILFHTVEVEGNVNDNPPEIGKYKNVLAIYKEDDHKVLYNSDGIPADLSIDGGGVSDFNQLLNRPKYDGQEMTGTTDIPNVVNAVAAETTARELADTGLGSRIDGVEDDLATESETRANADTTLQGEIDGIDSAINTPVMTDIEVNPNTSTTVVQLDATKKNLKTSVTTTDSVPLPVASGTQAGVMNSATFNAIAQNTQDIANIKGEVVAITGLPASPTQAELTTAWMNASGESELINGAGIYDVTNSKRWTYYSNDTTWHSLDASGSVTVNTWTNTTAGIVKGSTNVGQIFAESDGTGSVNGWDALSGQVSSNTSKLATIASGAEVNVQPDWTQTNTSADDYIKNKPTIDTTLSSSSTNAVQNKAIDAEFDKVAYVGNTITTPSSTAFVGTNNIQDGAVTANKINYSGFVFAENTKYQIGVTGNGNPIYATYIITTIPSSTTTQQKAISTTILPLDAKIIGFQTTITGDPDVNTTYYQDSTDYRRTFLRKGNDQWTQQFRMSSAGYATVWRTRIEFFE